MFGVSAISSALVIFALQGNFERVIHRVFKRFSKDIPLLLSFSGIFLVSIFVCYSSLVASIWPISAVLASGWGILIIIRVLWYSYNRTLDLINPIQQLNIIVKDTSVELKKWSAQADSYALSNNIEPMSNNTSVENSFSYTYDSPRIAYFIFNPYGATVSKQAIQTIMSFVRRYAEQGDYEVSEAALNALVEINDKYIKTKGKTFVAASILPVFSLPEQLINDEIINETLESLRQNMQIGLSRGDEREIRQTLHAIKNLVNTYLQIDYSNPFPTSKTHACTASWYLTDSIQALISHKKFDLIIEGLHLIGQIADSFIKCGDLIQISNLIEKIRLIACNEHLLNEKYLPVVLEITRLHTCIILQLLLVEKWNINYAINQAKESIFVITDLLLGLSSNLKYDPYVYLEPYYSNISQRGFLCQIKEWVKIIKSGQLDDKKCQKIIENIEYWATDLYKSRELFKKAIEKKSREFTLNITYWIKEVIQGLIELSNILAGRNYSKDLRLHARGLFCSLSYIPDEEGALEFVRAFDISERLFEGAMIACDAEYDDMIEDAKSMLFSWALKVSKHKTMWEELEKSIIALALIPKSSQEITALKEQITEKLLKSGSLNTETLNWVSGRLFQESSQEDNKNDIAALFLSPIRREMANRKSEVKELLKEIANTLSPEFVKKRLKHCCLSSNTKRGRGSSKILLLSEL